MRYVIISLAFLIPFSLAGQSITMMVINPQVNGNEVTYDVAVADFTDIVAFQYGLTYDTAVLRLMAIQDYNLSDFDESNFATNDPGFIENLWLDPLLEGVTLDDSTVIYRLLFEMRNDTFGTVCFSMDSIEGEFVNVNDEVLSVYVIDDCHEEPFLFVDHMTAVEDNAAGEIMIDVSTINHGGEIGFSIPQEKSIEFRLVSINGNQIMHFPRNAYAAGNNILMLKMNVTPGIYVLSAIIDGVPVSQKIILLE